jgi:hypothetical protein
MSDISHPWPNDDPDPPADAGPLVAPLPGCSVIVWRTMEGDETSTPTQFSRLEEVVEALAGIPTGSRITVEKGWGSNLNSPGRWKATKDLADRIESKPTARITVIEAGPTTEGRDAEPSLAVAVTVHCSLESARYLLAHLYEPIDIAIIGPANE